MCLLYTGIPEASPAVINYMPFAQEKGTEKHLAIHISQDIAEYAGEKTTEEKKTRQSG